MIRDEHGFIVLEHVCENKHTKKDDKKANKKKKTSNPYNKGSWKYLFWKTLHRKIIVKNIEFFHYLKSVNFFITDIDKDKPKIKFFSKMLKSKELKENGYILINYNKDQYLRISRESYEKLCKVKTIGIRFRLYVEDDYDEKWYQVYEDNQRFDTINEFCEFIEYYRNMLNGVAEVQSMLGGYGIWNIDSKIMVVNQDDTSETYKSGNAMMRAFGLREF